MKRYRMEEMTGGWFVGDFEPAAYKTPFAEVAYKIHPVGEVWPTHYQRTAIEITCVLRGMLYVNGERFTDGDIVVIAPHEVVTPRFVTDCYLLVVKIPSIPGDKVIVEPE